MRLKDACVDAGQYGVNVSPEEYRSAGLRMLRTSDLADGGLSPDDAGVFLDGPIPAAHLLKENDLLLSRAGTIGRSYLVPASGAGITFAGFLIRFRPRGGIDPRFLHYCLRSKPTQDQINAEAVTSTIQNFNAERYANLTIPDASEDEQRRIADFLDDRVARIDQIIAARRRQASLADAALLETARTLTTRGRSSATRPSGIAWMPEIGAQHTLWRIGQAFTTGSGTTPRSDKVDYYDGEIPWATTSDLRDSLAVVPPRTVTSMALTDHSALALYPAGTLLVAMYGATVGRAGILAVGATVNQACCALQSRGILSPKYAFYWLLAHRSEIMTLASGGGQPNISQDVVRGLRIPAPPWDEQLELAAALDESAEQADLARASLTGSVELLNEYKQSLITAAVTGEFDVTTAASGIPG